MHIVFAHLFMIHSFLTVLITLFTIAFIRCSVLLYSTFYLLFFFPIFIFSFSCTCYLLNTVKASVYEALRSLSFYMKTEATYYTFTTLTTLSPLFNSQNHNFSINKTHTLKRQSFVEKMKFEFSTMNHNF